MIEENETIEAVEEEGEQEQTEEPKQPADRVYTQAQVNSMLAKEAAKAKRRAKRELESKMAETPTKQQEPAAPAVENEQLNDLMSKVEQMAAKAEEAESRAAFRDATSGLSLDERGERILSTLFRHDREAFDAEVEARRSADLPPAAKGPGPNIPGAPNGTPPGTISANPAEWNKDDVARMRSDGTFLKKLQEHRASLPGGGGGLFPLKGPK